MLLKTKEMCIREWCLKKPYGEKWFAWHPVRVFGENRKRWLETLYRYRHVEYYMYHGEEKGYLYDTDNDRDKEWATDYYGGLRRELKEMTNHTRSN